MIWVNAYDTIFSGDEHGFTCHCGFHQGNPPFSNLNPQSKCRGLVKFPSTWHPQVGFSENMVPDSTRLS